MGHITLSPQHGLNPAIPKCYFCMEDKNMLILTGLLPGDVESPKGVVWDMEPCDNCKEIMKVGVVLISVKDGEMERVSKEQQDHKDRYGHLPDNKRPFFLPNPYRTGGWVAVKDDAIRRMGIEPKELEESILQARFCFVPDTEWDRFGMPREAMEGVPTNMEEFKAQHPST